MPNESGRTKAKILIVDDHPIVRQGLAMMLNQQDDLHLCCEANNLAEALAAMNACWHDLVIVDISLEGESGITLISKLYLKYPQISILVMSMHEEFVYAERALRLGAKGYIMKQRAVEFIQHAIRCILAGGIYLSDEMHKLILDRMNKQSLDSGVTDPTSVLTLREFEVLRLIGHGFGTRKISEKLNRSIKTIEAHRANIKSKLSLKTNIELIQFASLWLAERD